MRLKQIVLFVLLSMMVACAWAKPPPPPHGGMAPPPPPPPPPSPYARIHYDMGQGKAKIDVNCGAQTSIKDCANVVQSLLSKKGTMPPAPPKPPQPAKPQ